MLSKRSEKNLKGVHPDLDKVVRTADRMLEGSGLGFEVIEGLRTPERQAELHASGASQTLNSRHLTGHAVDLMATVNGQGRWDWPLYIRLAEVMKEAAIENRARVVWGGSWKKLADMPSITPASLHRKFPDGPHYELDRSAYP